MLKEKFLKSNPIVLYIVVILLVGSNIFLGYEVVKLKKITSMQSTIEARKVSLMVIYQKVLTNTAKEIAELKIRYNALERKLKNIQR
jgi:hypothetical protein